MAEWISGPQTVPHSTGEQLGGLAKFGLGVGATALLGNHSFGDKRGWDYFTRAARYVEEYSPGRVLRTFQASHALSALETASQATRFISPANISAMMTDSAGAAWLKHTGRVMGRNILSPEILEQGFRFEGGQLRLGQAGGEVLAQHAGMVRATTGAAPQLQMGYMRSLKGGTLYEGIKPGLGPQNALDAANFEKRVGTLRVGYRGASGQAGSEIFMFTGGQSRAQNIWRKAAGHGTALAERINQLARAPFDIEPFASIMQRAPLLNRIQLSVVPSSGLKTVGKITGKLGMLGTAGYLGYQELDHMVRNTSILDSTLFAEGITAGVATAWTRGQMAVSKLAEVTGGHAYREWQEGIAPGSTELSKLAAFPIMGALGGLGIGYGQRLLDQAGLQRGGMGLSQASVAASTRDLFFREAVYGSPEIAGLRNKAYELSEEVLQSADEATLTMMRDDARVARQSRWGKFATRVARAQSSGHLSGKLLRVFGEMSPTKMKSLAGAAIGTALIAPFLPGALTPSDRPEELEALYSGKKEVAIRKGRWWEFGRSPYEGEAIDRFRKHWYPRMLARGKEKAIWGEDAPSPLSRWYTENFTYDLERKHYRDRPYPITGAFGEDIPFIGPIVAATIGRLIKPAKLMHTDEWMGGEGGATGEEGTVKRMPRKFGQREEIAALGEIDPGAPISPQSAKGVIGEQIYRLTEMVGLPGFTSTAIKERITGTADVFDQEQQLESARRMYGAEREFWDLELGGGVGTTELIRRLVPHKRNQIDLYNPIRNTMPEWLPGAGEKGPDFQHGDPFVKVKEGELRLPGAGYAALNPELQGVDPANYPLIHQYKILSDVAPYTKQFSVVAGKIQKASAAGQLSGPDLEMVGEIKRQIAAKRKKKDFHEYQYREKELTDWASALEADKNIEGPGFFASMFGGYWETLAHNAESPLEFLTPVSPGAKLVHMRSSVEDYSKTQVYGTKNAFWGHPVRDFFAPFADATAHAVGWDGIPDQVNRRRGIEEYFDILKYVKHTRLENMARAEGDGRIAREAGKIRRETLFGVNPYSFNFSQVYRSLPRRDRDYYREFAESRDTEERASILRLVPNNEKALYLAKWQSKDVQDIKMAVERGLLDASEVEDANELTERYYEELKTEGFPKTPELWAEYIKDRMDGESYPDWYRRTHDLPEQLEGRPLPGPNWVGWHPAVDLQDIKLKVIQNLGESAFDYDIWPDQIRQAAHKPYLQEAANALSGGMSDAEVRENVRALLEKHGVDANSIVVQPTKGRGKVDVQVAEDRATEAALIARNMEA